LAERVRQGVKKAFAHLAAAEIKKVGCRAGSDLGGTGGNGV
jgi:hypothetical protein